MEPVQLIYDCAVVLFTGNMIAGLWIKTAADRTGDPSRMSRALKRIRQSDIFVTLPALSVILLFNYAANAGKVLYMIPATMFQLTLLAVVYGVLFFGFLIYPLRNALSGIVRNRKEDDYFDISRYRQLSHRWVLLGLLELAPIIVVLVGSMFCSRH